MSEIDVTKCEYKGGIECHIRDYPILNCVDVKIEDCHYKQLQQLKQENEELKQKLEKIKRLCINKEEARLLYGCKDFDFYEIVKIIESED